MGDQNSSGGPYCICRSYDDRRFMICCDRCNQWFHGDCVRVKVDEAKKITHFYCPPCQKANPALQTLYRSSVASPTTFGLPSSASAPTLLTRGSGTASTAAILEKRPAAAISSDSGTRSVDPPAKRAKPASADVPNCGNCIGCFRKENCGRCEVCKNGGTNEQQCLLRRCVNINVPNVKRETKDTVQTESDEEDANVERRRRAGTSSRSNAKLKNVGSRRDGAGSGRVGRPPKQKSKIDTGSVIAGGGGGTRSSSRVYKNFLKDAGVLPYSDDESQKPRQCYGPGCIYSARPQSKYCSDECGMKLAQLRIQQLLPSRLQQWHARRPVADEYEQRRLERIRGEHEAGRKRLAELDEDERELSAWREKCRSVRSKENDGTKGSKSKAEAASSDDPETSVYCVTCGNETSMKNAIKHFSKCFAKYESQTSYGSSFKAVNNLYNIFCDTYNKTNRTYCKRLRVICPEHSKEAKIEPYEICGSPLHPERHLKVADFDASSVCLTLKKTCLKHYRWVQVYRALIDMERLTQLLRLEELSEETRCIQVAQNSRGNLLALLLHHTVTHEEEQKKNDDELPRQSEELGSSESQGKENSSSEQGLAE